MTSAVLHEGTPESVGMDPARVQRIRELGAAWLEAGEVPSLVLLVARRGVVVLHEAFGVRHPDDTLATLRTDSIFPVASIAKPVTAAAVMSLVEDGLIGLNRPFIDYVPEWNVPDVQWLEEASIADLLRHTSGIDDLEAASRINAAIANGAVAPEPAPGQHPVIGKRLHLAAGLPLTWRPGSAMVYSNLGYILLGDIVRRVSDRPFWQLARERLFEPLGMHDTHFSLPADLRGRRVYRRPGLPTTQPIPGFHRGCDSPEYDEMDFGSGGLASTTLDLAIFLQMLLDRGSFAGTRVLSPATVLAMTRHQVDTTIPWLFPIISAATGERRDRPIRGGAYGFGLFIFGPGDRFSMNGALASRRAFGHVGNGGAYVWADPEHQVVGVMLGVAPRLVRDIARVPSDLFQNAVHAAIVD